MCLTCGCNDAHKKMGNNITYEDVRDVAVGNGQTVEDTLRIMIETADNDHEAHAQEYEVLWAPADH
jgi:hypothetical protein